MRVLNVVAGCFGLSLLLAACVDKPASVAAGGAGVPPDAGLISEDPGKRVPPMSCDASRVSDVVGKSIEDVSQPDLKRRSGASVVRVVGFGDAVTRDFISSRLNVMLKADRTVESLSCG